MPRTPGQLATYRHRVANALCVDCGCDLTALIAWAKPRCPEHHEDALTRQRRYNQTKAGMKRRRKHMNKNYAARRAAGLCVDCGQPADGKARCAVHRAAHSEWNARYYDRKESASC